MAIANAVNSGSLKAVQALITPANPSVGALISSATIGQLPIFQYLIGLIPPDKELYQALLNVASSRGQLDIVKELVEHDAQYLDLNDALKRVKNHQAVADYLHSKLNASYSDGLAYSYPRNDHFPEDMKYGSPAQWRDYQHERTFRPYSPPQGGYRRCY